MNLLRIGGWLLRLLAIVFLVACIAGGIQLGQATVNMIPNGGNNILVIALIALGIGTFIAWFVKATELFTLADLKDRAGANQAAIERVMRLTEVSVTAGNTATQPLPTLGDR